MEAGAVLMEESSVGVEAGADLEESFVNVEAGSVMTVGDPRHMGRYRGSRKRDTEQIYRNRDMERI